MTLPQALTKQDTSTLAKKTITPILLFSFFLSLSLFSQSNLRTALGDESHLYSQTKQVNQFFRRFNNEEDREGNRYYPGDSLYRNNAFRHIYLDMLFDKESATIDPELKKEFIKDVTKADKPLFLQFRGGQWFAELPTTFKDKGQTVYPILFLHLEHEKLGYKWVMTNVYFDRFLKEFFKGDKAIVEKSFLHPMSHELDFMNLHKAFQDKKYVEYYARGDFNPDYLSLLFYEIKKGDLEFMGSGDPKFHFFQIDGWYFEVSFINRSGYNTGWLITNLLKITDEEKNDLIKFYLP